MFERGVEIVLFTLGKQGAEILTCSGISAAVPATLLAAPVVNTMGGGDAVFASVIAFILIEGMPRDSETWRGLS